MIHRGTPDSYAIFSECENYRYELGRIWDDTKRPLVWIGLNPSTADEVVLDPTLTRIQKRSQDFGAGGFIMLNIFAFRSPKPKVLKQQDDPVGTANNAHIYNWVYSQKKLGHGIVCAWGADGKYRDRERQVLQILTGNHGELQCLGFTKHGHPRHPLFVAYAQELRRWDIQMKDLI